MIISRGRKYIFVHCPKTGGTALSLALEARAMADDILIGDTPKAQRRKGRLKRISVPGRLWKHSTLADIDGLIPEDELAGMFVVTLVRNPWDRLVSYYHWLREQGFDHPAVALAKAQEFSAFLNHPDTVAAVSASPYASYVRRPGGQERCDLFIRLEAFDHDVAPFERHLGFRLSPLARANPSERVRDWRGYYSEADRDLVSRLCAEDIERFGYRFG